MHNQCDDQGSPGEEKEHHTKHLLHQLNTERNQSQNRKRKTDRRRDQGRN
jgi:hypothetical protein